MYYKRYGTTKSVAATPSYHTTSAEILVIDTSTHTNSNDIEANGVGVYSEIKFDPTYTHTHTCTRTNVDTGQTEPLYILPPISGQLSQGEESKNYVV